ncbi:hypothetical protein FVEG_16780 [Fusarium verticillioides 7600]|uniref:Uncharacterized protein n=1 Tax=Gibberella moniliformis (strain M3125 / FGSC 7600) TaxID=334819 RepID=W7MHT0_GIBM7|nr:hypothetical protein FVEG_16780 [Fusarium verticillioides 7600]EWG51298.1 hypothetical protein FVEG_16780 [Fusarium verticillioides 7600]
MNGIGPGATPGSKLLPSFLGCIYVHTGWVRRHLESDSRSLTLFWESLSWPIRTLSLAIQPLVCGPPCALSSSRGCCFFLSLQAVETEQLLSLSNGPLSILSV